MFDRILNYVLRSQNTFCSEKDVYHKPADYILKIIQEWACKLTDALNHFDKCEPCTVYRGVGCQDPYPDAKVGDTIHHHDFLSTSTRREVAKKFAGGRGTFIEIENAVGTSIDYQLCGENIVCNLGVGNEAEILLSAGSKFRITSIEQGVIKMKMIHSNHVLNKVKQPKSEREDVELQRKRIAQMEAESLKRKRAAAAARKRKLEAATARKRKFEAAVQKQKLEAAAARKRNLEAAAARKRKFEERSRKAAAKTQKLHEAAMRKIQEETAKDRAENNRVIAKYKLKMENRERKWRQHKLDAENQFSPVPTSSVWLPKPEDSTVPIIEARDLPGDSDSSDSDTVLSKIHSRVSTTLSKAWSVISNNRGFTLFGIAAICYFWQSGSSEPLDLEPLEEEPLELSPTSTHEPTSSSSGSWLSNPLTWICGAAIGWFGVNALRSHSLSTSTTSRTVRKVPSTGKNSSSRKAKRSIPKSPQNGSPVMFYVILIASILSILAISALIVWYYCFQQSSLEADGNIQHQVDQPRRPRAYDRAREMSRGDRRSRSRSGRARSRSCPQRDGSEHPLDRHRRVVVSRLLA